MSIETGTVYMIDLNTGKQTPISHINDIEITSEEVTCLGEDVRTFIHTGECTIQLSLVGSSKYQITKMLGFTNNYRRLHGGRAIRWRKMK